MQTSFVPYLTLNDYLSTIQSGQLNNQILDAIELGGNQQRMFAESWAIGKIASYLGSYFDLDFEITPTLPFRYNKKYHAGDRIIIDFPEWVASSNSQDESDPNRKVYYVGFCVIRYTDADNKIGGIGYMCKTENSDTIWTPENWTAIGNQYDIYYIKYPYPMFVLNIEETNGTVTKGYYNIGDKVCHTDNHTYECLRSTILYDHATIEQYYRTNLIPSPNYFPNARGQQQWKDLGEYYFEKEPPFYTSESGLMSIGIGSESTGSSAEDYGDEGQDAPVSDEVVEIENSVWELGDNRDPVLVQAIVDLVVWRLHSRISPNNIPELRENNKNTVFQWLRDVQKGEQGIRIPRIQPTQIGDISWGSNIKKRNGY